MCGILDANVLGDFFRKKPEDRSETAAEFWKYVLSRKLKIVIAGKLKIETDKVHAAKLWLQKAKSSGIVHQEDSKTVAVEAQRLAESRLCKSNDFHVLALAKVSGARLLYTNDKNLIKDFGNKEIINNPKGRIYREPENGKFEKSYRKLLRENVCQKSLPN